MDDGTNLTRIGSLIQGRKDIGTETVERPRKYHRTDRKSVLFREAYERCKAEWTKGTLTKFYFHQKTSHLKKVEDWDYLMSVCNSEEKRGKNWCVVFWSQLKIKVIPTSY